MDLATPGADSDTPLLRPLHHITRIDIEPSDEHPGRHPTHGWQVRARRDGKRLSKFFADARHDGREHALVAAIAHRDRLLTEMPDLPPKPRKAWSNTGVVGLSVREKADGDQTKLSVQLNWVDAAGKRKAGSFSVDKWGFRRALWNGCLKLYQERKAAGAPVEEAHIMFARAQEPFQDLVDAEIAAEQAAESGGDSEPVHTTRTETNRRTFESAEAEQARRDEAMRRLEDALFS